MERSKLQPEISKFFKDVGLEENDTTIAAVKVLVSELVKRWKTMMIASLEEI